MVANVESMISVREVPWHREGLVLTDAPTTADAIKLAGLDWTVEKRPLYAAGEVGEVLDCEDHRAIVRSTDRKVLGVVGADYEPVQNAEAFAAFDPLIAKGRIAWETAGSLDGGRRIWAMGRVGETEVVPGDRVGGYLLITAGHDGSHGVTIKATAVRVVCQNTVNAALADGRAAISLRHTSSVRARIEEASSALASAERGFAETCEQWTALAKARCDRDAFEQYIAELVPADPKINDSRREMVRQGLRAAFERSPGTQIKGVRGTWWGAYNAATWHVTHKDAGQKSAEKRLASIWDGAGRDFAKRAYDLALAAV